VIELSRYRLRFPPDLTEPQVLAALLALSGTSATGRRRQTSLLVSGGARAVEHVLLQPAGKGANLRRQLAACVPGLQLEVLTVPALVPRYAWRLWLSSSRRPLNSEHAESVSRALLVALAAPKAADEQVSLQWTFGTPLRPQAVGTQTSATLGESWLRAVATAPFAAPGALDSDARRSLRTKQALPGWKLVGTLSASAASAARAQALVNPVLAALRMAEGPSSQFGIRRVSPRRQPTLFRLRLNALELVGLLTWPLGTAGQNLRLPVDQRRAQLLPPPRQAVAATGRLLGHSLLGDRPLHLGERDSEQHSYVLGPTGTGKSTFLVSQILQDIAAGRSVIALDAKGQLIDQILARYPEKRRNDLVILDPKSLAPVGLNPFAAKLEPALIADQLLGIFSKLYADSWGPRTADVLQAGLLTLAQSPGSSLACLPLLLTNERYRRRIVGALDDPLGVGDFWHWYEHLSPEHRQQIIAPSMNKLRPYLVRPGLRAIIGQSEPRFNLLDLFTSRRVLLADLAKGSLGPEGSRLIGTTLLALLWQTALSRSAVAPDQLRPVSLYVDEAQDFLRLSGDMSELLSQARSLRLSITAAHQFLKQIPGELQEALLSQARSRVIFQLTASDARVLAQGHPELTAESFTALPVFETYMSLAVGGAVTPYASVRTLTPSAATSDPQQLRAHASQRFGQARAVTDAALQALSSEAGARIHAPVGQRPRRRQA